MIYWDLFLGFLEVGCFAFGGAYGAIPLIRDVVLRYGWLEEEAISYMIAVSESTPGPIMVNMATYIGSTQGGFWGAVLATTAVVLPAFFIILLVMVLMKAAVKNRYVQAVLRGLKPCVCGIVLATGLNMISRNVFPGQSVDWAATGLTLVLAAILWGSKPLLKKKVSSIGLICIAALLGILVYGA